ncbi:hypothetical protein L1987_44855 [Smallanthus sonchifolius]|uniref:Uncharacterized protein n=1 Tax=Smallanthus sonchifolius TaxID=185202 RepID=A0ACB9GQH1_9ASTR|nr:hypothetical protein L1987_44855 [Smallanthus sonchifolius]
MMAMTCKDGKGAITDTGKYVRYTPEQVEALERLYHECPKPTSLRRQQLIRECPILTGDHYLESLVNFVDKQTVNRRDACSEIESASTDPPDTYVTQSRIRPSTAVTQRSYASLLDAVWSIEVLELRGCDLSASAARGLLELRHTPEKIICLNSNEFSDRFQDFESDVGVTLEEGVDSDEHCRPCC